MKQLSDIERTLLVALVIKALVENHEDETQRTLLNDLLNKISGVDRRIVVE